MHSRSKFWDWSDGESPEISSTIRTVVICIATSLQQRLSELLLDNRIENCGIIAEKMFAFEEIAYKDCNFCLNPGVWYHFFQVIETSMNITDTIQSLTNMSYPQKIFDLFVPMCVFEYARLKSERYARFLDTTISVFKRHFGNIIQYNIEDMYLDFKEIAEEYLPPKRCNEDPHNITVQDHQIDSDSNKALNKTRNIEIKTLGEFNFKPLPPDGLLCAFLRINLDLNERMTCEHVYFQSSWFFIGAICTLFTLFTFLRYMARLFLRNLNKR